MQEQPEKEAKTIFCQVCRHNAPIHESWCPVLTGVAVPDLSKDLGGTVFQGYPTPIGVKPQDLQPSHPLNMMQQMAGLCAPAQSATNMLRQGNIPREDGYEVAKIYREARERLLEELRIQVEVNRQLSRDLIDLRLELARAREGCGL
jgi:hypothetical protein